MAIVRNPLTGQDVEATKKGKNSKGQQIWLPKDGSKRFALDIDGETTQTVVSKPKKETKKSKTSSDDISTLIMINGNILSELSGKKNKEEVLPYFKNYSSKISENDIVLIEKPNGAMIYSVNINVGTKGN
jgi:hypothetical protein